MLILPQSGVPELDSTARERLFNVVDGSDTLCDGFAALVDDVSTWTKDLSVDNFRQVSWLLENPNESRGGLFALQGTPELGNELSPPWNHVAEWFIRDENGSLFVLYVVGNSDLYSGIPMESVARFYKSIEMEGRDGQLRRYPTFVTSPIAISTIAKSSEASYLFLLLPLVILGALLVLILSKSGHKKIKRPRIQIATDEVLEAVDEHVGELPEDASQALAAMYEKSEGDR